MQGRINIGLRYNLCNLGYHILATEEKPLSLQLFLSDPGRLNVLQPVTAVIINHAKSSLNRFHSDSSALPRLFPDVD